MHQRTDSGIEITDSTAKKLDGNLNILAQKNTLPETNGSIEPAIPKTATPHSTSDGHDAGASSIDDNLSRLSWEKGPDFPQNVPALWDMFIEAANTYPDNLAVASIHQKGQYYGLTNLPLDHDTYRAAPYLRWSYSEFVKGVVQLVHALEKAGVKPGFPVVTFVYNCAEFPLIVWAAAALGCTLIPIHPRNLLNKEEAIHIIKHSISNSPVDEAIIFAQNDILASQILDLEVFYKTLVVVLDSDGSSSQSKHFTSFLLTGETGDTSSLTPYRETAKTWVLTLFTSGTTALPKGVVIGAWRLDRWMYRRRLAIPLEPKDASLLTLPNNHSFYFINELTYHCCGGATIFPGPSFSPQSVPEIMEMERCTHLPMSPTMVHAVVEVARAQNIKFTTLKGITTGGAKLSVDFVRDCLEVLGSKGVEVIYGLTEAGLAATTRLISNVDDIVRDGDAAVGWVDHGVELKVCNPGETTPLPRNTEGELHYGSIIRADGYVGEPMPGSFYTDEQGQNWFATGDAAMVNDEGLFFIVGRIKDMIIRGGLNISPAAIEFILAHEPQTTNLNIQIVSRLDPIAGEVIIAVSQKPVTLEDIDKIQETILKNMGPVYLPEEVLTLEQLGTADFPKTMLGKMQKGRLTTVVREYLDRRDKPHTNEAENQSEVDELTESVQKIWKRTIGHTVNTEAQITDFADSITMMRIRDRFARDLGAKLSLPEILSTRTVKEQITMIREQSDKTKPRKPAVKTADVLSADDIIHTICHPQWFPSTKAYITHQIGKIGLDWNDVQTVTPASDFTQILTQADILNTSWSWKFTFLAKTGIDKQALRKAIEVLLTNNPLLSSFLFSNKTAFGSDIAFHVLPKPNQKLFDSVFLDYGSIPTKKEFAELVYNPYEYEMSTLPGLLVHFILFDIEDVGRSGIVMIAHHAPMDASYMQLVFDDLDKAIGGATELPEHVSYKTWADSYYSLRTSREAEAAVKWHVDRLQDLADRKQSVFPQLPRPHHYVDNQQHIQNVNDNGYHTDFHARGITNLRRKHSTLSAPTIIKAAWSLINIYRNGTDTAVFSNLQADRRRFPFVPKVLEQLSPAHSFEASNVAGPTLQDVVNIIPLHAEENVLDFLHRVATDQEQLNIYAAAPLKTILQEIGPINSEVMLDVLRSQIFNWTPGLGAMQTHNPNENYEPLSSFIRPSLRLVINVDVGGDNDETVYAQIKSPLYDMNGLVGISRDFEDLVLWLCDESNWSARCGDYKAAFRKQSEGNEDLTTMHEKKGHII